MAQPPPRTSFFGRDRERARLAELLAGAPLVTITGVGGVGKTRLAGELAAADAGPVHWCVLSAISDDADVAPAVAAALGRDRAPGADAVVQAVNERGGLLVIDNCEHVVRGVAELADVVLDSCPEPRLLCTSREPLGVEGEALLALDQLDPEDAIALFVDRARLARWDFELDDGNAAAVARVCERLDRLPLAIELAAARVRSLSPAEIAEHLDERFSLLARPRARAGERHRTLRATVDWSYRLLEEPERRAFERMSVFVGTWDLEAAEAVCEGPALDLLDRLVERSLVRADESGGRTRYGMLETLRHYGRDRLAERGDTEAVAELHAEHFARVADLERHNTEVVWAIDILRGAREVFEDARVAAHWSIRQKPNRDRVMRLLAPLWALAHSRHASEISDLCDEALAAWPIEHDELGQAALGAAAGANFVAGRPEPAQRYAGAAIEAERNGAPPAVIARRGIALVTYGFRGQVEAGLERLNEVVDAARRSGMPAVELEMRVLRAQALAAAGRMEEALTEAEATREAAEKGSAEMLAWAVYIQGTVLNANGDPGSEPCFRQSLDLARQVDFHLVEGTSLRQLAGVELRAGREAEAAGLLADAYEHFTDNGDWPQVWDVLRSAAPLFERVGQPERAAQILAGSHADPHAREPAPLEVAGIRELRDRLAEEVEQAEAAPLRVDDLGPALLGELRAIAERKSGPHAVPQPPEQQVFRCEGDLWTLGFNGQTVHLPDLKGLHDLARLLAAPGQEFHCLELSGAPRAPSGDGAGLDLGLQGHAGEMLDERAKAEYKQRILDLREEAELAEKANDDERAERARQELETLTDALASAFGLGGRARTAGDPAERARTAVAWRLRSALSKIDAAHPDLARHLRNSVRTGVFCSYQPERPVRWLT